MLVEQSAKSVHVLDEILDYSSLCPGLCSKPKLNQLSLNTNTSYLSACLFVFGTNRRSTSH